MDFNIKALNAKNSLDTLKTGALVIGIYDNHDLAKPAESLSKNPDIVQAIKSGDISGKLGSTLLLRNVQAITAERIVLVGLGAKTLFDEKSAQKAIQATIRVLSTLGTKDATVALPFDTINQRTANWAIRDFILSISDQLYRSDAQKSQKSNDKITLSKISFTTSGKTTELETAIQQAKAMSHGVYLAKNLGNLSANVCTPTYLAETAKSLGKEFKFKVEVLDRKKIEALNMGSFLSVTHGSEEPPKFIVLKYEGGKAKQAPIVLVGKGVTFDTGGISLKPGAAMDEMKYDMCGAASVLGTLRAVAELGLPINVFGVIPACENMPSGKATKPGDIVTSMSGQTIEILNTDAEGRLILCDALTYTERFKPAAVIDIATLTGACIIALGHHHSGLFSRDDAAHDQLANQLLAAGKEVGDTAWRLPLDDAYHEQLKSNFADVANIGGRPAGSVTAACFLERFTKKYTWAHLDVAGTAWKSGSAKGATGRPVPLLTEYIINQASK